jgi:replicative DNA helicase
LAGFTEQSIDKEIEKKIVTGLIVSTPFCRDVLPMLRVEYFEVDYARTVAGWVKSYYAKYKRAPGVHIQDLFNYKKRDMKVDMADLISSFLSGLSEQYVLDSEKEESLNLDYLVDQAQQYFTKQALLFLSDSMRGLVMEGKIKEAETELATYKGVYREVSRWVNPFSEEFVEKMFADKDKGVFSFPGKLGELTGPWQRGWLVAFMAPRKRGKSWFLMETALQAVLSGLNVVFISLEMIDTGMGNRILKWVTSLADEADSYLYPVFDCIKNQDGSCKRKERTNSIVLLEDGKKPRYEDAPKKYLVCSVCRGTRDFIPGQWWTSIKREALSFMKTMKNLGGFETMYSAGKRFRLMTYPPYSANMSVIDSDLRKLQEFDGFVPDLVVIDYADILRPESGDELTRESTGQTWIMLKSLAADRTCIVVTGTQGTRKSADKKNVKHTDVAEDIRKMDHVDLAYALSQTPWEKREGVIRVSVAAFRWKDFDEYKHVMVLQQLEMGKPVLDSEFSYRVPGKGEEE